MNPSELAQCALSIPHDLVFDLLSRLPIKSLCRFRCVSKHWNSTISDRRFIERHTNLSLSRSGGDATAIVVANPDYCTMPSAVTTDNSKKHCSKYADGPDDIFLVHSEISQSLNGLILIGEDDLRPLRVFNPSTREVFPLPHFEPRRFYGGKRTRVNYFGYDPISDRYKVVSHFVVLDIPYDGAIRIDGCYVFDIGRDNSWRRLEDLRYQPAPGSICVSGVLYFRSREIFTKVINVIAFDVRLETFRSISVPPSCTSKKFDLMEFEGDLAIVIGSINMGRRARDINVWVLHDTLEQNWTHRHFVFPSSWTSTIIKEHEYMHIVGQRQNGEIMVAAGNENKPISLFYLNFELQSVRSVEIVYEGKWIIGYSATRVTTRMETLKSCIRGATTRR